MRRCQYVFARGTSRGRRCQHFATDNGFCSSCRNRTNKEINNVTVLSRKTKASSAIANPINPEDLVGIGSFSKLCEKIPAHYLIWEADNYCRVMKANNISNDLAITARFITKLVPAPLKCGCECVIYVINVHTVICQYASYVIPITQAGCWETISTFRVKKNPEITDAVALLAILWQLTSRKWPDGFYQWLKIDRSNTTLEQYQDIVRRKLGL